MCEMGEGSEGSFGVHAVAASILMCHGSAFVQKRPADPLDLLRIAQAAATATDVVQGNAVSEHRGRAPNLL